MIRQGLAGDKV